MWTGDLGRQQCPVCFLKFRTTLGLYKHVAAERSFHGCLRGVGTADDFRAQHRRWQRRQNWAEKGEEEAEAARRAMRER